MSMSTRMRRAVPAAVVIILSTALGLFVVRPSLGVDEANDLATRYGFAVSPLNSPPNARTERAVAPGLRDIRGWISSVGAAVALTDFRGLGRSADACLVDPRDDAVTLRAVPGDGTA